MKLIKYIIFLTVIIICVYPPLQAQEPEYIEDEGGELWERRIFEDATSMQEDFESGGGEYIGEEEVVDAIESAVRLQGKDKRIDFKEILISEKELKFDNIKFGALTGVMIGGWMALVSNLSEDGSTSRDNARYIGVGAVFGVLLGTAIGTKSLYEHNLRSENILSPEDHLRILSPQPGKQVISVGSSNQGFAQINFNYRF